VKTQCTVLGYFLFFIALPCAAKLPFSPFECSLSGYIKGETYTDSRRTFSDEVDEISYFPLPQIDDPAGHDINARSSWNMDAFETRVRGSFEGLKVREAKLSGIVEIDFEIFYNPVTNVPHLRHAVGTLDWERFSFLFGQTWHPVVLMEPKTVNYNGCSPFDYYTRAPQFTFIYHPSRICDVSATFSSQVDFLTDGVKGYDSDYIRNGLIPSIHVRCKFNLGNHTISFGGDYKRITPRLESDLHYKVHERLNSFFGTCFIALRWPTIEIIAKLNGGQNTTEYGSIGGYAVKKNSTNPITHERSYTNLKNLGAWLDIEVVKHKHIKPGVFVGVMQNFGSESPIELAPVNPGTTIFGFVPNVKNIFRISPRINVEIHNITFAGEVEYSRALYGTITEMGTVIDTTPAELIRCTFGAYYFF
jgi:hypothetical protein